MLPSTLFYIAAVVMLASALAVVLSRNAVYSAILLVLTFFSLAVMYLLLEAYFLAVVEVLVYAGAIMVLFLFVIMLLNTTREEALPKLMQLQRAASLFLIVIFIFGILLLIMGGTTELHQADGIFTSGSARALGTALFTDYLLPFEVASLLLLVALIGTVYLAKRKV
ncbi:MAG TPA: NADH-quinone oxidoreductase subunit J [Candidatus Marinimicrobia bacterium]|jgi:NADH-quinone oxidoreductase subunit J|nr:NADH-quinone oxidoreductase subunit J [Candidatus Neomarinimicrobiota bacterium]HIA85996.1 NADH-quinone oxidoreductase subunit J [Candidatus Neomarinimicrobiota bacterium]HIB58606.1 NADH-quinone oxidoreductase subunit J [Candidatus Neomarinimicrobiota bacterium]HIN46299.1 NADH-quinone oxidoreductase subunit J [Candidatus Neomarinimicrobiota bacterium]